MVNQNSLLVICQIDIFSPGAVTWGRVGKMTAFKSKVHATGVYWHFPE